MADTEDPRRQLPGVDSLLSTPPIRAFSNSIRQEIIVRILRAELSKERERIQQGKSAISPDEIAKRCAKKLASLQLPSIRKVVNATGVILHTGLGRAPLSEQAKQSVQNVAEYCNLEFDLPTGERGDRQTHLRDLLCAITGAEDALVVNNNAAAVYLVLNTLAYRKEAVVSRGQLIEIGGSFRLPDIMKRAGVKLVEVGTTNRTRIDDFRQAISANTALLLRAYPSNYRIDGFTESVSIAQLAELKKSSDVILVDDLGGGVPRDWTETGLAYEPNIQESLDSGADVVLVSGDKVLGGPQAGIILGRSQFVQRLKKSPLARVLRTDKLTIAALSATLREHLHPSEYRESIPTWQMLTCDLGPLQSQAEDLLSMLLPLCRWSILEVTPSNAEAGSGTLPAVNIESFAVRCLPEGWTSSRWSKALRLASVPVVGTVRNDCLWLDLRTIQPHELHQVVESVRGVFRMNLRLKDS
jgi:L-seryl-tRNA(Ser) seleniumtransferase